MKNFFSLLLVVFLGFTGNAQIVNIPDAVFKAKLLGDTTTNQVASSQPLIQNASTGVFSVNSYNNIDTNNDGQIQVSEAEAVTYLDLNATTDGGIISNFTGIESFTHLAYLSCYNMLNNTLTNLNLSQNTALQYLSCSYNNLASLNVSQNTALQTLSCEANNLGSLTLEQNPALKVLYCGSNLLTVLDVANNTALNTLSCPNNQLTGLNVSQNPALGILIFNNNLITSVNLSQNPLITYLSCFSNHLTNLDVTHNTSLLYLQCSYNQFTSLDLSHNQALKTLYCGYGQLQSLDMSHNQALEYLSCYNAPISSLNVSQNPGLKELYCNLCLLTTLDVQNTSLIRLDASSNQLTSLVLKNGNPLSWNVLNFSGNPLLKYVCADEDDLTSIQQKINGYGIGSTCQLNSYCSFTPGGTFYTIQGNVRFDHNANGCDANDIVIPQQWFGATNGTISGAFISNDSGNYSLPVIAGTHTITPIMENPSYFTVSPTSINVTFPGSASPYNQDFCVSANGTHNDLEVALFATETARPGFDVRYKIIYKNKGNTTQNGSVNVTFDDSKLDLVSAIPSISSQTTNNLNWSFSNLLPFETREIGVVFNINSPMETPAVNAGDILSYTAVITGAADETTNNNSATLNQKAVNSLDPNDKTCSEGLTVPPAMVGQYVHYVIRFENNGTANAQNIVVKDIIDTSKFDISTLVPLHSSHNFVTRISNTNKVEFIFEGINLPFDNANNDGYVVFKIKTKPTLAVGNTFSNSANIYFDYNFPILTNTYTTAVTALGNQDFEFNKVFSLSPVPAKNIITITNRQNVIINSVSIYNTLGQLIQVATHPSETIDVSGLTAGSYIIKIVSDKGTAAGKFIKE